MTFDVFVGPVGLATETITISPEMIDERGNVLLTFDVAPLYSAADYGIADTRRLGIMLRSVSIR